MSTPYREDWERTIQLTDGKTLLIRPIRSEDEDLYPDFLHRVTPEDLRLRFFMPVKDFSHAFIARFTQLDLKRAMAFVAIDQANGALLGVGRLHRQDGRNDHAEFAVLVRSDLKGHGLGWLLMEILIDYARKERITLIEGEVLAENSTMLKMCREFGFYIEASPNDPHVRAVKLALDHLTPALWLQ